MARIQEIDNDDDKQQTWWWAEMLGLDGMFDEVRRMSRRQVGFLSFAMHNYNLAPCSTNHEGTSVDLRAPNHILVLEFSAPVTVSTFETPLHDTSDAIQVSL